MISISDTIRMERIGPEFSWVLTVKTNNVAKFPDQQLRSRD